MTVKSIRVRLLIWSALMLFLVVTGFAGLVFLEYRSARLAEVDSQLEIGANSLDAGLHLFPAYELRGEPMPKMFEGKGGPGPPKDRGPNIGRPQRKDGPPILSAQQIRERLLASVTLPSRSEGLYYGIWRADGSLLKSQGLTAEVPRPFGAPSRPEIENRGSARELVVIGPQQTVILVGTSLERVTSDLNAFALSLGLAGFVMMVLGSAGGWFISRRIFRPITLISQTAASLSANSLSQRIDVDKLEVELVDLAQVLNATFQRLEESFERQRRFTADASHELRTPLAVLRSQAELTLSRTRTPEEYQKSLQTILQAAERMTELTNRLLKLAQVDAGQLQLQRAPVEVKSLLEELDRHLAPLASQQQVQLLWELEPYSVLGDEAALRQVFANLLTNAISYNKPQGTVRIQAYREGDQLTVNITDTGPGIPATDQLHLFERFYRVDKARSRHQGGYGLGLAITQALVHAMGGEVGCRSTEGEGSTFWVRLSLAS